MVNYKFTFSPTGGTQKAADLIANGMGGEWNEIDICVPLENGKEYALNENDVCIISVPSFGGRVPEVAIDHIRKISANGTKAILVCTYGNRAYEDTLTELQDETVNLGFKCVAGVAAVAEHSIVRKFANGRPDENDEKELKSFGEQIKKKLENSDYELHNALPGSHNTYRERGANVSIPEPGESCNKCGACANKCPTGAITAENSMQADEEKCIACMKCVAVCPQKARAVNDKILAAITAKLEAVCTGRKENELFI